RQMVSVTRGTRSYGLPRFDTRSSRRLECVIDNLCAGCLDFSSSQRSAHMSHRRAVPILAVAASAALMLAGCQSVEAETSGEPVDLTMAIWSTNEQHLALFDEIANAYIAANPDLVDSIVFESTPAADYPS